ncbi:hypothetical protein RIF29_10920 [Crotalaria pallida]|uniref:Uncharacterized protein n=1 Tax=Crotalaria pallida TaxID=3830 RepID=A0AAN9FVQ0_CROPI
MIDSFAHCCFTKHCLSSLVAPLEPAPLLQHCHHRPRWWWWLAYQYRGVWGVSLISCTITHSELWGILYGFPLALDRQLRKLWFK